MSSIYARRSVRDYTEQKVEKEKIMQILKAAMQAPSAANQQPWQFLVVEDKNSLIEMSVISPYTKMLAKASCAVIVLGDTEKMIVPEMWEQDLAAATQNLMLEACEIGVGSVWLGIAPSEDKMKFLSNMFNLPQNIKPFCIVSIGYPAKENVFVDRFDESRVHFETIK